MVSPLPPPSAHQGIRFGFLTALFHISSYQKTLELLCFALSSFSSPSRAQLPLHISLSPPPLARCSRLHITLLAHHLACRSLWSGSGSSCTSPARSRLFHLLRLPSAGDCQREGKAGPPGSAFSPPPSASGGEPQGFRLGRQHLRQQQSPIAHPGAAARAPGAAHSPADAASLVHGHPRWPRGRV